MRNRRLGRRGSAGQRGFRGRFRGRSRPGRSEREARCGHGDRRTLDRRLIVRRAHPLLEFERAVERVGAARRAIDESGTGIVLTGRSEGFVVGRPDIDETLRRLRAYAEAGAACLYAPRIHSLEDVAAIVDAVVSPKPVYLLINAPFTTVSEAAQLGVRRTSVGGTLPRTAWGGFLQAARQIADEGTFSWFDQLPNVDGLFGP